MPFDFKLYLIVLPAGPSSLRQTDYVRVLSQIRLARKNTFFGKTLIPGDRTDIVDSEGGVVNGFHYDTNVSPPNFCCASL